MRRFITAGVVCAALLAVPAIASAAGHHHGNTASVAGCTASGNTVSATGLPTDQVINFFVTDSSGKTGWVLGYTTDGTWDVSVPAANGSTTYEFTGRTSGTGGAKYTVFTSCQV
jgi:hypothetical protein